MDEDSKLSVIFKPVGAACNLRCHYCFYKNSHPHGVPIMSDNVLKKAILQSIQGSPKEVRFIWHGGEPLLAGINFYRKVAEMQQTLKPSNNYEIRNTFQTNGALLTQEWINFCKEHNFTIGLSLDGPREIHDKQRVFSSIKGSFNAVMETVELLKHNGMEFACLGVITQYSLDNAKKIFEFFRKKEIFSFDFSPYFEKNIDVHSNTKRKGDLSISPKEWADFMIRLFDIYITTDDPRVKIRFFDNILKRLLGGRATLCSMTNQESCGSFPTVAWNGDIYFCDDYEGNEGFKLGNILKNDLHSMLKDSKFTRIKKDIMKFKEKMGCLNCKYSKICGGGCPRYWFWRKDYISLCSACKKLILYIKLKMNYIINKVVSKDTIVSLTK